MPPITSFILTSFILISVDVTARSTRTHAMLTETELAFREWVSVPPPPPPRVSRLKHPPDLPLRRPLLPRRLSLLVGRNVKLVRRQTRQWVVRLMVNSASWSWVFVITSPAFMTVYVWRFLRLALSSTIPFGEIAVCPFPSTVG